MKDYCIIVQEDIIFSSCLRLEMELIIVQVSICIETLEYLVRKIKCSEHTVRIKNVLNCSSCVHQVLLVKTYGAEWRLS